MQAPSTLAGLLRGFVAEHRRAYAAAGAMLLGIALLNVWIPGQVGRVVDALVAGERGGTAWAWLLLAGLGVYGLRVGWRLALFGVSFRLGQRLRLQLLQRLGLQAPAFFQTQRGGDLMALATNDVDAVEQAAGEALLAGFDGTATLLLVLLTMAVAIDPWLALAALLPFPFMAWAFWFISERVHRAWAESLAHFGTLSREAQQALSQLRSLRAMGLSQHAQARFGEAAARAVGASARAQRWEAAYEPAVGITLAAASALALGVGAWRVAQGALSVGQLTAFTMLLGQLIWPMFAAGWVISLLERGRAGWQRLAPVLQATATRVDEGRRSDRPAARLAVKDLNFGYEPGALQIQGLTFDVQPGRMLAVVGPTGSGKSTLLRLLLRQWEPTAGGIELDGTPLSGWRRDALAAAMAWVPQEPFLFSASVAENLALARPEASAAERQAAAEAAALHEDLLRLPEGDATRVGEKGVALSGGQRQRVAIARALLAEAPLLLLDDALSAVDTATEAKILRSLRERRRARGADALIVVTHRLSAALEADEILVLQQGRVAERGTHEQLLAAGGWYAAQWRYQQLEASLND